LDRCPFPADEACGRSQPSDCAKRVRASGATRRAYANDERAEAPAGWGARVPGLLPGATDPLTVAMVRLPSN
jgi:hypothetical protein